MKLLKLARRLIAAAAALFSPGGNHSPAEEESLDFLTKTYDDTCLGRLGRYRVQRVLGSGGMGTVLLATDPTRNRTVALKVLAPFLAKDSRARRRFLREGKIAMSVHHPHVLATHAIESLEGQPFIVSEYVGGGSLQDRLDRGMRLPAETIRKIGIQIADGLAAIHAKGLVHTDVKPSNVLLDESGQIAKISDFGLARVVNSRGQAAQGTVFATPQYASPEQVQGLKLDRRSDLFSLGGTLYAMCTGRPPFPGESSVAIARQVCNAEPRPIAKSNAWIPRGLSCVIGKLMSKQPSDRYQTAAEVATALKEQVA